MSNIISFFQKLIKGGVGIRAGGLENFSKINKRGGTIIRYSRVIQMERGGAVKQIAWVVRHRSCASLSLCSFADDETRSTPLPQKHINSPPQQHMH